MKINGSQYYDDDSFFDKYTQRRSVKENPNDIIEKPEFLNLTGNVENLRIIDLGCGNASFGIELLDKGARSYLGIEGSKNMYMKAQ